MKDYSAVIDKALKDLRLPKGYATLYEPIRYTLDAGGKHLRPLLALVCAGACGVDPQRVLPQAIAIEMFHNFTLIHDDVMDRSDTRRGRPTVFAKNGTAQAILSGDALLTLATLKMAEGAGVFLADFMTMFNDTALKVYEGQQMDMDFENEAPGKVSSSEYIEMILRKTAALLVLPCSLGPTVAGNEEALDALMQYATNLGLAFQLRDDWLDTFGDEATFGKPIGGDIRNRKHTLLYIAAYEAAKDAMNAAYEQPDPVKAVTEVYRSLEIDKVVMNVIEIVVDEALKSLDKAELEPEHKEWLANLARKMASREK